MNESTSSSLNSGRITGSTLKIIAIIAMFIDHIGAILMEPKLIQAAGTAGITNWDYGLLIKSCSKIAIPYFLSRLIGRIAFPIFVFLLVEGFLHTRSLMRYGIRLFIFALISEIPFNLALGGQYSYPEYQNVFFTLVIGFITITFFSWSNLHFVSKNGFRILTKFLALTAGMVCAWALDTDYGYMGILTIIVMYELRNNKIYSITGSCICLSCMNTLELTSFLAVPLIRHYNGKRGLQLKYVFYAFYPAHLFLLYLIGKSL